MPIDARPTCPCPFPGCDIVFKVREDLPAGARPCLCGACQIWLSWATNIDRGRVPSAELVKEEKVAA